MAGVSVTENGRRLRWGVAKWQGTGFWSRDRRFESCRPSPLTPTTSGRSLEEPMLQRQEVPPIFAAVLAAGKGTRMKSNRAKVLHTICGVPMVNYAIAALEPVGPRETLVVVGHRADEVKAVLPPGVVPVLQEEQKGTGDA